MKWTQAEYEQALARIEASKAKFLRANSAGGALPSAVAEQAVCDDALGKAQGKETHTPPRLVSVVSYRRRLLDPDNGCIKFFIDSLRRCGLIKDDTAKDIAINYRQEKVAFKEAECTVIEIT